MTQPAPEESNEALDLTEPPPGEHDGELTDGSDADDDTQRENAGSALDQPSDDSGQ